MNRTEFEDALREGGVDIKALPVRENRKPIYCYAAKGPILVEDNSGRLVGIIVDYKDDTYSLTPAVRNTHVLPGGRWEAGDASPEESFRRERGEEYLIPQGILNDNVIEIGDFYAQFPCPRHGVYADLTSVLANRMPIEVLREVLGVPSSDLDTFATALNERATESQQRLIPLERLMSHPEQFGFVDGKKLVMVLERVYGITPQAHDTEGSVLIKLPTNPTDSYESRRDVFTAYLYQNRLVD